MRKYLYLIILCLWGNKVFASPSLKSITIDKSLEYGEYLSLNPWYDFMDLADEYRFEEGNALQPYGESINWYVDGKYCDEEVFSVSRHTSSGDSHPWGELTNYPYQLATYLIKANEGQVGLHVFSITLRYLYLYKKEDGTKITEITSSTIKYNIQLPEPYVVLSNDNTTLTFYFDTKKKERNGMDIGPQVYNEPWINYRNNITTVIFDDSFANYDGLTSTAYWFYSCSNLSTISGIQNLNTSKVNDMSSMFQGCRKLETLDLSSFNTENVTDMSFMFMGCNKLTTLDVSNFNTQNVTNMLNMFYECYALRALDVSKFNTQNVTKMDQMFSSCISLTALDVSKFDTKNVTDMSSMFSGCNALTVLDVSKFDTKNVTDMSSMFSGCNALTALNVSNFDTQNVTNMLRMFHECKSLTALDVSNFNTKDVTRMDEMFADCNSLATLDVSKFDTQNVTNMYGMFSGCHTLTSLDVSKFDTQNVTNMGFMFEDCNSLVTLDVSKFDTRNVTNMKFMFDGCKSLNTLCLTNINTKNVTTMEHMFYECESLTTLDISMFNTQNVTNMFRMFWGCKALKILDLSNFNTNKVTKMSYMFYWCDSLTTIYAGPNWSTRNVTDGEDMFGCCEKLIGGQGTKYDYKHTDHSYAHIDGGLDNPGYFSGINAPIMITVVKKSRLYGDENPAFTYEVRNGNIDGEPVITCEATSLSPVGEYEIKIERGSITNSNINLVNGTLIVQKTPLTISGGEYTMKQGEVLPTFVALYEGFKNDETEAVLITKPMLTTIASSQSEPGTYDVIVAGAEAQNYAFTYVKGKLTIEPGIYKLTYMVDGEVYKTIDVEYGTTITPEAEPTKEGYTFSGWSEIPATMPAHDVTITGTFSINSYKLTYTVDGQEYKSSTVVYGATITPETAPTKEGYTFSGWSDIPETMPAHDVTITGTFSINSYKLMYMIDNEVYKNVTYEYGATITPEPTPEGNYATFEWTDLPQTMPAHDVVVHATYTTGITDILKGNQQDVKVYSPNGKMLAKPEKGINIIRMKDGTTRKVMVK